MDDAVAFVGMSPRNIGLKRAVWFFFSLAVARVVAILLMGLISGSLGYMLPVLGHVMPTAMAGDAMMIGCFIALTRKTHMPLYVRILITAFATTAVTFALQAAWQAIPESLLIAFAVGSLFSILFLTGLHVIKARPVVVLALSMLLAVFVGSLVGDVLTFVRLKGTSEQLPRLLATAIMVLEHGAVFTAVTCAFMSFTQPDVRPADESEQLFTL